MTPASTPAVTPELAPAVTPESAPVLLAETGTRVHDNLIVEDRGGIRILRIDREDKLGALSSGLVAALGEQFERVRGDRSVRVVVLTGTGRGFIAGADVGEYFGVEPAEFVAYQRRSRLVFDALEQLPQVTIAAVNGYAFGGGFEIALCCDFIVASEWAKFALPEVKLGLLPGGGGTQRLARSVGTRFTKELVMTGRTVKADEAKARGIVTEVFDADAFAAGALELAETLAANAPIAVREAKRLIDDGVAMELTEALTHEQLVLATIFDSDDAREGISAFVDKRAASFTDR